MANVFVSYSRVSAETVEALVEDVKALGHEVWFDQELIGGQSWWDKILEKIRAIDIFVFVVDHSSLRSKACTSEYEYADALGIPIIPIVTDGSVRPNLLPRALQMVQHVSYIDPDKDAAFRLARAFMSIPVKTDPPVPLPPPPPAPMSYIAEIAEKVRTTNTLDFGEQSGLFIELKNVLSEDFMNEDTLALLGEFRSRQDLLATIAREIDDLFRAPRPPTSIENVIDAIPNPNTTFPGIENDKPELSSPRPKQVKSLEGMEETAEPFTLQVVPSATSWKARLISAAIAAVLGGFWTITVAQLHQSYFAFGNTELFLAILFVAVPFASVALFAGFRMHLWGVMLLFAAGGVAIWPIIAGVSAPDRYLLGAAFGSIAGGITAAIWDVFGPSSR